MYLVTTNSFCGKDGLIVSIVGLFDRLSDAEQAIERAKEKILTQSMFKEYYDKNSYQQLFRITQLDTNKTYSVDYVDDQITNIDVYAIYNGDLPHRKVIDGIC
jgi:hypothetical protein